MKKLICRPIIQFIFFSPREGAEFKKSCNLIGSWSGRNFLIQTSTASGIRRVIYFRERISGYRPNRSRPFIHFHTGLINAGLSLFRLYKARKVCTVSKFN